MPPTPLVPKSPRLAALQRDVARGDGAALAAFWARIEAEGTPLVEAIEGDGSARLLTLLCRGAGHERMLLVSSLAEQGTDAMLQLADTDVWYRSYRARSDLRTVYTIAPGAAPIDWLHMPWAEASTAAAALSAMAQRDELNPRVFDFKIPAQLSAAPAPPASIIELPDAPPQPWADRRDGVPAGVVKPHRLDSAILGTPQIVWTYAPPGYDAVAAPYGLLVVFDGFAYTRTIDTPAMLDNLLAESRIAPLVAAFVQGGDRMAELGCNPAHARFVAEELVPWMRERFNISSDPAHAIVAGCSLGGLAASYTVLQHPGVFGNALSQSGSYWWNPDGDAEPEWLTRQYVSTDASGLRFYLDVGLLECGPTMGGAPSMVNANRHLRDVLQALGHDVTYREFAGGHDFICWRGTLADGLLALAGAGRARA